MLSPFLGLLPQPQETVRGTPQFCSETLGLVLPTPGRERAPVAQDGLSAGSQPCHPLQVSGRQRGEGLLAAWIPPGPGSQVYELSVQGRWLHGCGAQTPADGVFIAMAGLQAHGQQQRDTQQVRVLLTEQAGSQGGRWQCREELGRGL